MTVSAETSLTVFRGAPQNSGLSSAIDYKNPRVKTFIEQWLLTAYLSDGSLLTVLFLVHNAGPGSGYAGVMVRFMPPGREKIMEIIGSDEPQSGADPFDLRFGPSFLRSKDGAYEVSARGPKIGFDGRLEPLAAPYTAGDGRIVDTVSGKYMSWGVMVPRGRLRGELTTGGVSRKIEGFANLEHAEATLPAADISRTWRTVRLHTEEWTVNFLAIDGLPRPGPSPLVLVHVADANGSLLASNDCSLSGDWLRFDPAGEPPAAQWGFACRFANEMLDARIVPIRSADHSRGFDGLPFFIRIAARLLSPEPLGYLIHHSHEVSLHTVPRQATLRGRGYDEFLEFKR